MQDNEILLAFKAMLRIREVEERIAREFFEQKIFSFLHLMTGQEASPVGVISALDNFDQVIGNHRSHGHYLAKGGNLARLVWEVFGDVRGCCRGFGGSMHMVDREVGFMGSTPILGSAAPISAGFAFKKKLCRDPGVVVCFIGDGAAEEGVFLETINLAASKELPILFVIEDNKYSVNTPHAIRKGKYHDFGQLFGGLGANYQRVDGQRVEVVFNAAKSLRDKTLGGVPSILHLDVNRRHGHSGPMKENTMAEYRMEEDTIDRRDASDCIALVKPLVLRALSSDTNRLESMIEEITHGVRKELDLIMETIGVRK